MKLNSHIAQGSLWKSFTRENIVRKEMGQFQTVGAGKASEEAEVGQRFVRSISALQISRERGFSAEGFQAQRP